MKSIHKRIFMQATETQCRPQKHFGEDKDETCQVNSMFIAKYLYERNTFVLYVWYTVYYAHTYYILLCV